MSDYVPSIGMARARYCDSIVRKDGVPHSFGVTPEEHAKNHAEFDRMIAEVERAAAERALTEAATEEERVSQQYERTADGMREREEWADSNRYANYAAGHAASAHALRKRAARSINEGERSEHRNH